MDGWMDGRADGQTDRQTDGINCLSIAMTIVYQRTGDRVGYR